MFGVALAMGVVSLVLAIGFLAASLPPTEEYLTMKGTPNVSFLDASGRLIARRGAGQGAYVELKDIPPHLIEAVLAIEDRRFYGHWGVDPEAMLRALVANVEAGRVVQGGSTITQQLAKNLFLESDRTYWRKAQEMLLALYLEARFKKEEILVLYLNRAYFGAGAFGVDAAARRYFAKPAKDISLTEAAILAGLLKAPSRYSPQNDFEAAEARAKLVLNAMVEEGWATPEDARKAAATRPKLARAQGTPGISYFIDWVMEDVPGYIGGLNTDLIVETTVDSQFQRWAEDAATSVLDREGESRNAGQVGLVELDNEGAVRAMVGGRSYAQGQFNHATQAKRQPGSAFKPFVFLAALETGKGPESMIADSPLMIGKWAPANFDDKYEGMVTLRRALSRSLNSAAVRLIMEVGPRRVAKLAHRLGITTPLDANASLALGTSEVTLVDLVAAYTPFANGGQSVSPYAIIRIKTASGRVLYERKGGSLGEVVAPARVAQMNMMMADTLIDGTGRNARLDHWVAAGKTGTSQNFRDAWFVGYVNGLVTGVWTGNDDGAPMDKVTGGGLPGEIWREFMNRAVETLTYAELPGAGMPPSYDLVAGAQAPLPLEEGTLAPQAAPMEPGEVEPEEPDAFDRILNALTGEGDDGEGGETATSEPPRPRHKR
ncbi:MAG: PBP1A family penicillin-binding protein [Alphaproteobacteria bacterium]|nr:PBP1A family penicillin-binding protein [Alphaproteobacteria bacterium]